MENMKYWEALRRPPPEALRAIQGGRLTGKTDINPQWRYKVMTEQFGPCGVGWKFTIDKLWLEPASDEICAFAQVSLSIKVDGEWSDPIPGVGGSMLLEKESRGLHVSDEAYKMAITDALSVCMKMLGVAADVYAGLFDGSKFTNEKKSPPPSADKRSSDPIKKEQPMGTESPPPLKNLGELYTKGKKYGLSPRDICEAVGVGTGADIKDFDVAWKTVVDSPRYKSMLKSV